MFRYSDETAEAVASGEKLLKESETIYESFADMMPPEDAKRYLDFLENGSREGLTSAELAGVEKADALLVSRKVGYEDVWDLRNAGDVLESGSSSELKVIGTYDNNNYFTRAVEFNAGSEGTGFTYKVYQRNDIDWNIVRTTGAKKGRGLTNAQAAEKYGLAPILNDGYFQFCGNAAHTITTFAQAEGALHFDSIGIILILLFFGGFCCSAWSAQLWT